MKIKEIRAKSRKSVTSKIHFFSKKSSGTNFLSVVLQRELYAHSPPNGDGERFTMLVAGDHLSLLAVRFAKLYKNSTIVSVHTQRANAQAQLSLVALLQVRNHVTCHCDQDGGGFFDDGLLSKLKEANDRFRYQLLG